jgi:CheY-like chemotaxis protein
VSRRHVVIAVPDLFFSTRITATARLLDVDVTSCPPGELLERCRTLTPDLVIVDLHATGNLDAVRAMRLDPATHALRVVGFYSHVDAATRAAAIDSGVTDVLPRSAFTARLAALLGGE